MVAIEDLVLTTPPAILYHYTSQCGLIGIVRDREIWASKIQFLNDSQEFRLALDIARRKLKERLSSKHNKELQDKLNRMLRELDDMRSVNVCVASFSKNPDQLSQWRGYASDGVGFSIGFNSQKLKDAARDTYGFRLLKCSYDQAQHEQLVEEVLEATINPPSAPVPDTELPPECPLTFLHPLLGFRPNIMLLAAIIKHETFSEEQEWRLVSKPVMAPDLRFRPGRSMLVPYCTCPTSSAQFGSAIEEVFVGPCPDMEEAMDAVQMLLFDPSGQHSVVVKRSSTTFRNW